MPSTYINRTVTSAGNQKTFTVSYWLKRTRITSASEYIFCYGTENVAGSPRGYINILDTTDTFGIGFNPSGSLWYEKQSTSAYRDVNGWYHVVWSIDTTQASEANRVKLYVNGSQVSLTGSTISQNFDTGYNSATMHELGSYPAGRANGYLDGLLAHIHLTDGYAYDASTFGEYSATSGVWKPITDPSVTYGTNGFFLKFANAGSLGTDSSGNSNNFTVNGSGTQTLDNPSNVFATLNPLIPIGANFSNGNLTHTTTSGSYKSGFTTLGVSSGKWYSEFKFTTDTNYTGIGVANIDKGNINTITYIGDSTNGVIFQAGSLALYYNGGSPSWTGASCVNGDIIGIALDIDNGFIYWHKNGTYMNSGVPTSGATGTGGFAVSNIANSDGTGTYTFGLSTSATGGTRTITCNFGNGYFETTAVSTPESDGDGFGKFEYAVPTGFYSLCTKNIITYG